MNQLISTTEVQTMSSREIAELTGKTHKNVIRDIRTMIEQLEDGSNLSHEVFQQVTDSRGYTSEYLLTKNQTLLLMTGYSVPLRQKLINRWQELEEQQAKQLSTSPDCEKLIATAISAIESITQAALKVITEINTLTAQQQHTEPLEISAPRREHFPAPLDMITISEVREKYFNNKDVLMQLIVSFGVRSELHHYGYTPDLSAPMNDGLIYDRRQLLAILAALRATSHPLRVGGKFFVNPALPEMKFTFKRVPTLHDGITADDITSAVEVLLLMK